MKWVPDRSGRLPQRPHYDPDELDAECEHLIVEFLQARHGRVEFPIRTDDITVLIESVVDDLDLYADLSAEKGEVEGLTEFRRGRKPRIKISASLAAPYLENRLRTTLTHEFGHVHFHGFLSDLESMGQTLFAVGEHVQVNKCKRETIVGANRKDWMEWQAGYACGALLMPVTSLRREVQAFAERSDLPLGKAEVDTPEGANMIKALAAFFRVSDDAARVRLLQRGHLLQPAAGVQQRFRWPS